jgi:hypothetical protein
VNLNNEKRAAGATSGALEFGTCEAKDGAIQLSRFRGQINAAAAVLNQDVGNDQQAMLG